MPVQLSPKNENRASIPIRLSCWTILALSGLTQAWFSRHRIAADGISYLEIAKHYLAGNFDSALNSYWSPLYSWLAAILMAILRPSSYWEVGLLYLINYLAFLLALVGFECWLSALIRFQERLSSDRSLSKQTMRIVGYSAFLLATLLLITLGWNSPDMVATAIGFFIVYLLFQFEAGRASFLICIAYGILLGLEYLARAAFAPFVLLHIIIAGILLWRRKVSVFRPVANIIVSAALLTSPFIVALSISKGRITFGDAGKLNYGWEVCGAARYIHWQGEPYDIGKPLHPTQKVLSDPATYVFPSPVQGSYPPWYDPSYWYAGISPHLKWKPQIATLAGSLKTVIYLFVRSPIVLPAAVFIFFMGWRNWLSARGIFAYWFLWLPAVAYIAVYMLVFVDSRYIAGSLLVMWMCLLASISLPTTELRMRANAIFQVLGLVFALMFVLTRLAHPALLATADLIHHREAEWNLNWMIANRFEEIGLHRNSRIAWIGEAMDAEWASILEARIVGEVPVVWERNTTIMRNVYANRKEIDAFWKASPEQKARVFQAFRSAGATLVLVDIIPPGVDSTGWHRVLPRDTPHLPWSGGQHDWQKDLAFMWLTGEGNEAH